MPETPLGRATAGQLRRAGFEVAPPSTDDSATTGFEVLCNHVDERSKVEKAKAAKRGDDMPATSPASRHATPTVA